MSGKPKYRIWKMRLFNYWVLENPTGDIIARSENFEWALQVMDTDAGFPVRRLLPIPPH